MQILTLVLLALLAVGPVLIALLYGDGIIQRLSLRRRERRKKHRRKRTRALPIREDEIDRLLAAEDRRDGLDDRIAERITAFAALPEVRPIEDTESELAVVERAVLARESRFGAVLDYAWVQSETIEILSTEARLLRRLADLPEEGLPVAPTAEGDRPTPAPTDRLMANLQAAVDRKARADTDLRRIGERPEGPGSRFDATVDDDS